MGRRPHASKKPDTHLLSRPPKSRAKKGTKRLLGRDEGVFSVPEDFNKTDEELLRAFEGDDRPLSLT